MLSSNTSAVSGDANYIEDVFSTWLYTGNGSTQNIINGIDLSTKGGLVWLKGRNSSSANNAHVVYDTVRGRSALQTYSRDGAAASSAGYDLTSFNTDGFSVGPVENYALNSSSIGAYASWTFRKQPKFFDVQTITHTSGTANTVDLSGLGTVGCVIVKQTNGVQDWFVWHRSLTAGNLLYLNGTVGQTADNNISVSGTTLTMASGATTGTYIVYAYAHNAGGFGLTGTDNVISCGSFTTGQAVTLGYEPQWLLIKDAGTGGDWYLLDAMRGLTADGTYEGYLTANNSTGEATFGGTALCKINATGFNAVGFGSGGPYIYIAIRRGPMKVPTDATKVFSPNVFAAAAGTQINTGFPVDMQFLFPRDGGFSTKAIDRLRGVNSTTGTVSTPWLATANTAAETNGANTLSWNNTGFQMPTDWQYNLMSFNNFRRAPSFFDEVCYTGDGTTTATQNHNLTVTPELVILKCRSSATDGDSAWGGWWVVAHGSSSDYLFGPSVSSGLNSSGAGTSLGAGWLASPNFTATTFKPFYVTASSGSEGIAGNVTGKTYAALLFATCPGVSKVGSYTGTGTTQQIACGFAAGARFVLIKRTDSAGDWYVWDTARGIVSGNDPHLSLNTTSTEVTTDDTIDPDSSGFIVNQLSATNVNVSSATYIFLAIA
jgi:hypothetical protein